MEIVHEELSGEIIGAAMAVLNELKPGLDEKLYENALVLELEARGHKVRQQKRFPVSYRGHRIGVLIPDLIVDELVLVDTEVVTALAPVHMAQMTGYLAITKLQLGMLLNFHDSTLQWKRVVRQPGRLPPQ